MPGDEAEYTVEVGDGREVEGEATNGKLVSGRDEGTLECRDETGECIFAG